MPLPILGILAGALGAKALEEKKSPGERAAKKRTETRFKGVLAEGQERNRLTGTASATGTSSGTSVSGPRASHLPLRSNFLCSSVPGSALQLSIEGLLAAASPHLLDLTLQSSLFNGVRSISGRTSPTIEPRKECRPYDLTIACTGRAYCRLTMAITCISHSLYLFFCIWTIHQLDTSDLYLYSIGLVKYEKNPTTFFFQKVAFFKKS